jgi:uncharacterized membrane protein YfhO
VQWTDTGAVTIAGPVRQGDLVALQVNADPGWRATQDGREIAISQNRLGFVVLHPTAAAQSRIELRYHGTWEQRIMAVVSILAWIAAFVWLLRTRPRYRNTAE